MVISAVDPEERNLIFSLVFSTSPQVVLSSDGHLEWEAGRNETVRVEVSVTDECSARTVKDFELSLISCHCQHGGKCIPDSDKPRGQGHYKCACAAGYAGDVCEFQIDECRSSPCLHGKCEDMVNGYVCHCTLGYRYVTVVAYEVLINSCANSLFDHSDNKKLIRKLVIIA